ncbi:hypothetical protein UlMin_006715 [Ulmus minor]
MVLWFLITHVTIHLNASSRGNYKQIPSYVFVNPILLFKDLVIILNRVDLSELEVEASLDFMLNDLDEALIGAFLVVRLAKAMLKHALKVEGLVDAVDIVGIGGDGANTMNISIGASILAVACGAKVAKQGSRSSSSACGSVDVLEEMGVVIALEPEGVTRCVIEVGIGFMMAPIYHPAMKAVHPVRKKLKVKTVFNVLGPMLNPARVPYAVVGVYVEDLVLKMAKALQRFGMKRELIVDSFEFDYIKTYSSSKFKFMLSLDLNTTHKENRVTQGAKARFTHLQKFLLTQHHMIQVRFFLQLFNC